MKNLILLTVLFLISLNIFAQNCFTDAEIDSMYLDYRELNHLRRLTPLVESSLFQCDETKNKLEENITLIQEQNTNNENIISEMGLIVSNKDKEIENLNLVIKKNKRRSFFKGLTSGGILIFVVFLIL